MDKPFAVYSALVVFAMLGLFMAFEEERLLWRTTNGNRISVDDAYKIYGITIEYMPNREIDDVLDMDIRYFLCDGLRRRDMKLGNVKSLLEVYPNYMNIHDRDGTDPFEIACQFASLDIVQYMVELDEKRISYVDRRGNTPLHWACQRRPYLSLKVVNYLQPALAVLSKDNICYLDTQGPEVVNYLLEKQMSLVTVANKDGDLPIHVASDCIKDNTGFLKKRSEPARIEIVWRLLLAYPDCLSCVGGSISGSSNGKFFDDKKKNR